MKSLRCYGKAPYQVAVIHGGPGAPGEMTPVARELSSLCGILEPLQTKTTIQGQLEELHGIVRENGSLPLTLIGHSWGAMLSYLFTAQYPSMVKKLILISSGVFEEQLVWRRKFSRNVFPAHLILFMCSSNGGGVDMRLTFVFRNILIQFSCCRTYERG